MFASERRAILTRPQVQRYSADSGLRDITIAENEIVLTYLLQLLAEGGILDKPVFKGGTCLRKMFIESGRRISTESWNTGCCSSDMQVFASGVSNSKRPYCHCSAGLS